MLSKTILPVMNGRLREKSVPVRATSAHSMPVSAKLEATDRSTPRVSNTNICPMTKMTRIAESLPMSQALRGLQNTGARQPTANTINTAHVRGSSDCGA